jgi:two-component sensor histidine kinase
MHDAINYCLNMNQDSISFLLKIEQQMNIVADLSRADILLYGRKSGDEAVVLSHAQPRSIARVYSKNRAGRILEPKTRPEVFEALILDNSQSNIRSFISEGAPVIRTIYPIYYLPQYGNSWSKGRAKIVACLAVVTNLIEYERQRLRNHVYQEVIKNLHAMLLRGRLFGTENLTSFGEQDGIIYTDMDGIIRYASGVAANLYRRMGYKETLVERRLLELETTDEDIRQIALEKSECLERETEEAGRVWVRKAIPIMSYPNEYWHWLSRALYFRIPFDRVEGVVITIHDATETRRQDQEIRVKNAMIQEVHHRVKNNLQTIAGLIRMQARRVKSSEAKVVLDETLNRILSVAVIHEFLSNENTNAINIKEVSYRIISQFQQGMLSPDQHIRLELAGDSIHLPARQATACSLVINELVQNALEHGFTKKREGVIQVELQDHGDNVVIKVSDDGDGLPNDFQLDNTTSLGLHIVKILVEGDLRGKIELGNENGASFGTSVNIVFPKTLFKGEKGWKEHVSS